MMRQLLILALVFSVSATVPAVQAAKKDKNAEQAEGAKKDKKKKKDAGEGEEAGDAAKKARPKPTDVTVTGVLSEGEAKGDQKVFVLETADGSLTVLGKGAQELGEWVGKTVTIACKGKTMENKKGKSLMIVKLGDVTEVAADGDEDTE